MQTITADRYVTRKTYLFHGSESHKCFHLTHSACVVYHKRDWIATIVNHVQGTEMWKAFGIFILVMRKIGI
eukprot:4593491-Pleurochrysis_carterae.AAC.1